jgi:putative peptidoglycan lipid II flippase
VASGLAAGSLSVFNYARNFQSLPVSLVGVAFAIAVFPAMSAAYARGDRRHYLRIFGTNLVSIIGLTVCAALAMVVFGELGIGILLGGGEFGADDVARTAAVLGAFALSVPFESVAHLLSRAIFATRQTLYQALASIAGLAITMAATILLLPRFGLLALPLGFAIGQAAKVALLALSLAVRLRTFPPQEAD